MTRSGIKEANLFQIDVLKGGLSEVHINYDNIHPAVVHVVGDIVQRANRQNKSDGVCGEMAGEPACASLLLDLYWSAARINLSAQTPRGWQLKKKETDREFIFKK